MLIAIKAFYLSFAKNLYTKTKNMKFKQLLPMLLAAFLFPFIMNAQVTTSSITGFVKSGSGEPLDGATVTAIHLPS
jgi:hypothetical protein